MAHLNWHGRIVQVWQHNTKPDVRIHVSETGRVLRTTGKRDGKAKVLRIDTKSMQDKHAILSTLQGRFADVNEQIVRDYIEKNYHLIKDEV